MELIILFAALAVFALAMWQVFAAIAGRTMKFRVVLFVLMLVLALATAYGAGFFYGAGNSDLVNEFRRHFFAVFAGELNKAASFGAALESMQKKIEAGEISSYIRSVLPPPGGKMIVAGIVLLVLAAGLSGLKKLPKRSIFLLIASLGGAALVSFGVYHSSCRAYSTAALVKMYNSELEMLRHFNGIKHHVKLKNPEIVFKLEQYMERRSDRLRSEPYVELSGEIAPVQSSGNNRK